MNSPRLLGDLYNRLAFRAFCRVAGPHSRVLDVGCGVGSYLKAWQQLGWAVEGLEVDEKAAQIAAAHLDATIQRGRAEDAPLPVGRYDVITLCHTLEHFHSPTTALRNLRPSLKPAGRLLIMVPNFASMLRLVFGRDWLGLEVPRHLFHFEPVSLAAVLAASGYEDIRVRGSAHAGVLVKHIAQVSESAVEPKSLGTVTAMLSLLQLPTAVLRRADMLWATATIPTAG